MTVDRAKHRAGARVARHIGFALVVLLVGVVLVVTATVPAASPRRVVTGVAELVGESAFYDPPSPYVAAAPGTVVRTERLLSAPAGAIAWRVLYHSRDARGTDLVVSGLVVAPDDANPTSPAAPASGRTVVGWAHPTTGAAARCAPSNGIDPFDLVEGLPALLKAGYIVAAPDYPGLGTPGQSSYLIGASEGNSLLDAVRAARTLPGVRAGQDVVLWGHSQGGQAVLFAGQDARTYAPDLTVRAAAVAAPATQLATLISDHSDDVSGVTIGSYAFAAYQSFYAGTGPGQVPGLSLQSVLTDDGAAVTPKMASLCLFGQLLQLHGIARPLVGRYLRSDPGTTQPWATLLAENTPGSSPLGIPLYVAQGDKDALVVPSATEQYVSRLCAAGEHVTLRLYAGATHGTIAFRAMSDVSAFLTASPAGRPPASTC